MHIAIAGNIGSGKTSLTELLAPRLGCEPYFEESSNPYLSDFYDNMLQWSFHLQICFLARRMQTLQTIGRRQGNVIQDRTIYEDAHIFATNLHEMGLMSSRDFTTYMEVFAVSAEAVPHPDLLIYLRSGVPNLIRQIRKRGREYEMSIRADYLERLNQFYENWITNIYDSSVLIVNVDEDDFVQDSTKLDKIEREIRQKIGYY